MKQLINWIIFFILIIHPKSLFSKQLHFDGLLLDKNTNNPIQNANIYCNEIGTESNNEGYFNLKIPQSNCNIIISHINYEKLEISTSSIINNSTDPLKIYLKQIVHQFKEININNVKSFDMHKNSPVISEKITMNEIKNSPFTNLRNFLESKAYIHTSFFIDGGSGTLINGIDAKNFLILIDGHQVSGKFNNRFSFDQIPMDNIKSIEIIKGPGSSLYGSEAMGGVINIKLINPSNKKLIKINYNHQNYGELNINGKNSIHLNSNFPFKKLFFSSSIYFDFLNTDIDLKYLKINQYFKLNSIFKVSKLIPKHAFQLYLSNFYNHEIGESRLDLNKTKIFRNGIRLNHTFNPKGKRKISQTILFEKYLRNYKLISTDTDIIFNDDYTQEILSKYDVSSTYEYGISVANAGFEFTYINTWGDRFKSKKLNSYGFGSYFQYDMDFNNKFNIYVGGRYDYFLNEESAFSPRLGYTYKFSKHTTLKINYGGGFRRPSFIEKYTDWIHEDMGYKVIGNPELKPELSKGFSTRLDHLLNSKTKLSIEYLNTYFKNYIDWYDIGESDGTVYSYQNIKNTLYQSLIYSQNINFNIHINWSFNAVFNYNTDLNNENTLCKEDNILLNMACRSLPNTRPLSIQNMMTYKINEKLSISNQLKWVNSFFDGYHDPETGAYISNENAISSYSVSDLSIHFNPINKMNLEISILNIGDFIETKIGQSIGRNFRINLSWKN